MSKPILTYGSLINKHEPIIQELDSIWYKLRKLIYIQKDRQLDAEEKITLRDLKGKLEIANRNFIKTALRVNEFNSDIIGGL